MARRRPRTGARSDGVATRTAILEGARRAVVDEGFHGATSAVIAAEAGVSESALYYHFGALDSLLAETLEHSNRTRLAAYHDALDGRDAPEEVLDGLFDLLDADRRAGHTALLVAMVAGATEPELREVARRAVDDWLDFVESTLERVVGQWPLSPVISHRRAAELIVTYFAGSQLLERIGDQSESVDELGRAARRLIATFIHPT